MERELFVCECEDVNHQFIITYFDDDVFNNEICIEIHLSDVGLWNRIKYAFQYLLGKIQLNVKASFLFLFCSFNI